MKMIALTDVCTRYDMHNAFSYGGDLLDNYDVSLTYYNSLSLMKL